MFLNDMNKTKHLKYIGKLIKKASAANTGCNLFGLNSLRSRCRHAGMDLTENKSPVPLSQTGHAQKTLCAIPHKVQPLIPYANG